MANLEAQARYREVGQKGAGRRKFTSLDMAIVKKDIAARNAQIKRGEVEDKPNHRIYPCGCGVEGCFIHTSHENINRRD